MRPIATFLCQGEFSPEYGAQAVKAKTKKTQKTTDSDFMARSFFNDILCAGRNVTKFAIGKNVATLTVQSIKKTNTLKRGRTVPIPRKSGKINSRNIALAMV
jgi:hypothetical protein